MRSSLGFGDNSSNALVIVRPDRQNEFGAVSTELPDIDRHSMAPLVISHHQFDELLREQFATVHFSPARSVFNTESALIMQ
jgi:hypothetical protein